MSLINWTGILTEIQDFPGIFRSWFRKTYKDRIFLARNSKPQKCSRPGSRKSKPESKKYSRPGRVNHHKTGVLYSRPRRVHHPIKQKYSWPVNCPKPEGFLARKSKPSHKTEVFPARKSKPSYKAEVFLARKSKPS
jgi:hypothetical protein